jgi:hypothetical protein
MSSADPKILESIRTRGFDTVPGMLDTSTVDLMRRELQAAIDADLAE